MAQHTYINYRGMPLLTVGVVLPPGAVNLSRLVNAEEEPVGRVKAAQADIALQVVVASGVPLKSPRTVDSGCQDLQGFMADSGSTGPCGRAGCDQEEGETCQTKGGRGGQDGGRTSS